ncbi:MAG: hypothetical protein Q9209_001868 [Squamulea sp. 1 TL-2023]
MADASGNAPLLSTPATHIFEGDFTTDVPQSHRSSVEIQSRYEIERTAAEIKHGGWTRIALQFPDNMLPDAPAVFESLSQHLAVEQKSPKNTSISLDKDSPYATEDLANIIPKSMPPKLFILADTSYGACCVDEIAAEHVDADLVVHYGRACLSPTARLPVIHVFTYQPLEVDLVVESFKSIYSDYDQAIILTADVTYASHLLKISTALKTRGYRSIFTTDIIHNPLSPLPNRTIPQAVQQDPVKLGEWRLFHISDPPDSLLLILSSRVRSIHVFSTTPSVKTAADVTATVALRRRYALLTSVSTVPIFGILINTLSVKNYLHIVEHVKSCISVAGKKSYTFVVGKVNAAKVANFSEIGAWVVIGCWESSLIDSKDFWKPVLTPFELELALVGDDQRIWSGKWISDFEEILRETKQQPVNQPVSKADTQDSYSIADDHSIGESESEPESVPPEFDLRTGRYVSNTRPIQARPNVEKGKNPTCHHRQLVRRTKGEIAKIGDRASPGAEFLQSNRTWKGLGSDFQIEYDDSRDASNSAAVEGGRSGTARGYLSAHSSTRT